MYTVLAALAGAVEDLAGDPTPESITAAMKAMPEKELPGSGGQKYRCNGKALPLVPAGCVRGTLLTTLDADGQPTEYEMVGASPIED